MKFEFKNTFLFILILLFSFGCSSVKKSKVESQKSKEIETSIQKINNLAIKTGAEDYEAYLPLFENKKIGIVTNPTGIVENKKHLVDFLIEKKVDLQKRHQRCHP